MKKLAVLTGAGISAESGLQTFRDKDGLWEGHRIEDVATPEAFLRDPEQVNRFYNQRRSQLSEVVPNDAHTALAELERHFDVTVITQNVDDLHERAGSRNIIHLHGELVWGCSSLQRSQRTFLGYRSIQRGEKAADGSLLRPDIVWFGEDVPEMGNAIPVILEADVLLVIGTSLEVYPAAGLVAFASPAAKKYVIDPNRHFGLSKQQFQVISDTATRGMKKLCPILVANEKNS